MFLFALFFCLCFMFLFVHSFLLSKVNETCKAFYYDVVNGKGSLRYNIATQDFLKTEKSVSLKIV